MRQRMPQELAGLLALLGVLLVAGGLAGCALSKGAGGIRIDDRQRDAGVCGTGDEDSQCSGRWR
jgi:hypothetical protein